MADAMKLLETYSVTNKQAATSQYKWPPENNMPKPNATGKPGSKEVEVQFAQTRKAAISGTNGKTHKHITCLKCKQKGHYANVCPDQQAVQLFQATAHIDDSDDNNIYSHFLFAQISNIVVNQDKKPDAIVGHDLLCPIPNTWILLNSQSSVSIFNDAAFLTDICACSQPLTLHTNGGSI